MPDKISNMLGENNADEIVKISQQYFTEADNARKPIENIWNAMWSLFNNSYDFSKKEEWQSKQYVPMIPNSVKALVGLLKRALIKSRNYFAVDTFDPRLKPFCVPIFTLMKSWYERIRFVKIFVEGLHSGSLNSLMIYKIFWRDEENSSENTGQPLERDSSLDVKKEKKQTEIPTDAGADILATFGIEAAPEVSPMQPTKSGSLRILPVNPYDFWLDPTGRYKYCIHKVKMDLSDLKDIAKNQGSGYDRAVVESIQEGYSDFDRDRRESSRTGQLISQKPTFRRDVMLKEYWGDIIGDNDRIIHKNVTWTVANEKYLVRKPIQNPFIHGKWPFLWTALTKKAFSVYQKSFFEDSYGLAVSMTDLFNMLQDGNAYAMAKMFEIDIDMIVDPDEIKNGIYPGLAVKKQTGGSGARMITETGLGVLPPQALRLWGEMERNFQNATGLTEFLMGKPSSRGRPTATEVTYKGQQSMSMMEDVAFDIEDDLFVPMLEMSFLTVMQYQKNFDDPRLQFLSEDMRKSLYTLADKSDKEKKDLLDVFKFSVRGISSYISKQEELNKLNMWTQTIANHPEIGGKVNWDKVNKKVFEYLNWDPEELMLSDEEYQAKQQQIQAQAQQQQMLLQKQGGGR